MPNTAQATWNGKLKEGDGRFSIADGDIEAGYSFKSRFEGEGPGTNPEALIAAAHASCFSMASAADMERAGIEPESVATEAAVTLKMVDGVPTITKIVLTTTVKAPGAEESAVREAVEGAKRNCPVSRALGAVETIELDLTVEV